MEKIDIIEMHENEKFNEQLTRHANKLPFFVMEFCKVKSTLRVTATSTEMKKFERTKFIKIIF